MALDNLSSSLRETFRKITGSSYIDKNVIKEMIRDIQRALLKADVNVKLTLDLSRKIEERSENEKPPAGMTPQDYILKIVYEELLAILGKSSNLKIQPQTIMLVGLYGQGKTTTAGKLARFFIKKGLSTGFVACDVHRPAAFEQLRTLSEQTGAKFFGIKGEKNPVKIFNQSIEELKDIQVKIVDTSGRDSLDSELLDEITKLKKTVNPDEVLLVIDATVGQQAGPQAKSLMDATGLTGVIITKMDGTGKAGGALSAIAQTGVPVYMIGTGEHLEDFEIFSPKKFLGRLLGMGDPEALLDVAQEADISDEKAEETMTKIMSGKFNLMDMYDIWEKFAKPSLMKRLFDSIPVGKMPKGASNMLDLDAAQEKIGKYTVILDSMTYKELENPEIINAKVIRRVSRGSGTQEQDVRNLLKEFRAMKENAKMMKGNRALKKMMRGQMKGNPDLLKEFED